MEIILKKDKTAAYLNYRNCVGSEQLRIIQKGAYSYEKLCIIK